MVYYIDECRGYSKSSIVREGFWRVYIFFEGGEERWNSFSSVSQEGNIFQEFWRFLLLSLKAVLLFWVWC